MSICLKLKISVTTEPIGLYSSTNIPIASGMGVRYFLGGGTPEQPEWIQNRHKQNRDNNKTGHYKTATITKQRHYKTTNVTKP